MRASVKRARQYVGRYLAALRLHLATLRLPRSAPRLITVTTGQHRYTLRTVALSMARNGIRHERWSYSKLFSRWHLPRAVYILADFDRLHPWQIELAGIFRQRLIDDGMTVLNDPRRFVPRAALLKRLYREGINSFTCWLPAEGEMPDRYPVFLRTIHAHRGVESELLNNEAEARKALEHALSKGRVQCDLVFVEYAAEAAPGSGKFRKHACYGVNGTMIRALTVTDEGWVAKNGTLGAATPEDYDRDLAEHHDYPHRSLMERVFEVSGVEFGRVDFGMVRGRPEIYEMNCNPYIAWGRPHPNPARREADKLVSEQLVETLVNLPFPKPGRSIKVFDIMPRVGLFRKAFRQP